VQSFRLPEGLILSVDPHLRCLRFLCIAILVLECCFSRPIEAQTTADIPAVFDCARDRDPMISLNGVWRFHPGDDPDGKLGWAKPDFDDSSWPLLRSNAGWGEQGYRGYTGFAWYRFIMWNLGK
jgi:phosphoserine phosphatase RsbU/P